MPVAPQTPKLARGFDILFDQEKSPATTPDAARVWAKAYTDYAVAGGVTAARAKEPVLAAALTTAFNPELAGGGPPLFIQALQAFWLGLPVPEQLAVVVAVIPSGSVNSPQPDNATPKQQADGLAATIAAFTLGSVKVQLTAPPNTILPLL
jgi:hypothetical protein